MVVRVRKEKGQYGSALRATGLLIESHAGACVTHITVDELETRRTAPTGTARGLPAALATPSMSSGDARLPPATAMGVQFRWSTAVKEMRF